MLPKLKRFHYADTQMKNKIGEKKLNKEKILLRIENDDEKL